MIVPRLGHETTGIGAGIVLWPNAMFVLEQLGLLNKILKVSAPVKRMRRFNHLNLALNSMDIEALNLAAGFTSRSILRADLMAVLQAEARALDIKIHYNHELTDLAETSSGIRLSFNHSHSIYNCQTLIGADGRMKSTLRKFLLGDNTDTDGDIFVIHTEFPRFIINLIDDEIEWFEDFDNADQEELEIQVAVLIEQASEFYDREMKRYESN